MRRPWTTGGGGAVALETNKSKKGLHEGTD